MAKWSTNPTNTSPATSDTIMSVKNSGTVDVQIPLSNLITFLGSNGYNPYKFFVYRNAGYSITGPGVAIMAFDTKLYDTGNSVDVVTHVGRFTAPVSGFYHFTATVNPSTANGYRTNIELFKNGVEWARGNDSTANSGFNAQTVTTDIQLVATDYVEIAYYTAFSGSFGINSGTAPFYTYFSGHLISIT